METHFEIYVGALVEIQRLIANQLNADPKFANKGEEGNTALHAAVKKGFKYINHKYDNFHFKINPLLL